MLNYDIFIHFEQFQIFTQQGGYSFLLYLYSDLDSHNFIFYIITEKLYNFLLYVKTNRQNWLDLFYFFTYVMPNHRDRQVLTGADLEKLLGGSRFKVAQSSPKFLSFMFFKKF